jgi:hypothetical protein
MIRKNVFFKIRYIQDGLSKIRDRSVIFKLVLGYRDITFNMGQSREIRKGRDP